MPASLRSEKVHSSNKESSVDVVTNIPGDENAPIHPIDPKVLRRATLKIDFYLIPIVGMFYLLSFLLPMNLIMKRLGANVTLPVMVILWGVVCACQGAVHSYHGLLVCRFFLGVLEGGLFHRYHASTFQFLQAPRHAAPLRHDVQRYLTCWCILWSSCLREFETLMENTELLAGSGFSLWREPSPWLLDSPLFSSYLLHHRALSFSQEEEREAYCRELVLDWSGDADTDGTYQEVFSWSEVASAVTDAPHVLVLFFPFFFAGATIYGLAYLYSFTDIPPYYSQLLTVPPYACSFVFSIVSAYFCDKYKNRGVMATVCALIAAGGYAIFLGSNNEKTNYAALYLQIIGSYAASPCLTTWNSNNVQPHYRRATAIAIGSTGANLGGIMSTWLFNDPPRFETATRINLAFSLGTAASSVGILIYFRVRNAEKRREVQRLLQMHGDGTGLGGWDSPVERKRLGDRHPRFEFTT
ncbi:MFS general substrate transporter [Lactarius hatsudake]|nr:MFS general substrate transporter [Lactarius hatsudake]